MLWALAGAHAASIGLPHLVQLLGHRGDALQAVWLHNVGVLDAHSAYSWQHIFWLDGNDLPGVQYVAAARGKHGGFVGLQAYAMAHKSGMLPVPHEVVGQPGVA